MELNSRSWRLRLEVYRGLVNIKYLVDITINWPKVLISERMVKMLKPIPLFFIFLLTACSPKLSSDWTKDSYQGHPFKKIAVVGISDNLKARISFEDRAVELFKKQGVNAIPGINVFPPDMSEEDQQPKNLIKIIQRHQLDGVITMSLVDSEESERYRPGETYTYPSGYYRFGRNYVRTYRTVRTPGYYESTKSYLIEAIFYDVSGELYEGKETMVWKGQSSLVDPSSIESAAKSFTKKLVSHTLEHNIIKAP